MGSIQQFKCPSCQKNWQLRIGHGIRHAMLGQVMEAFSEDIQKNIVAQVQGGQLPLFYFGYQAAVCRHCQDIVAVPVLQMIESGQTYFAGCPECGSEVDILEEDSPVKCPKCRNAHLEIQETGHWD